MRQVGTDHFLYRIGYFFGRERRANHLPNRCLGTLRPAECHLIPLLAILIDPKNADLGNVVMPTRINTTRDIEFHLADIEQVIQVFEAGPNGLGDGNRTRIRQRAIVATRAGDHVGQQSNIGCRQPGRLERREEDWQAGTAHIGQHQILVMGDANLAKPMLFGKVGHQSHFSRRSIARRLASTLEGDRHRRIAGLPMRVDITGHPTLKTWQGLDRHAHGLSIGGQGLLICRHIGWRRKLTDDPLDLGFCQLTRAACKACILRLNRTCEGFSPHLPDQDFDAGLIGIITTTVGVIDPQDRFNIKQ